MRSLACSRSPPEPGGESEPGSELDHAADPVLRLHELEAAVHLLQAEAMRDERIDVDLAREIAVHERRHVIAPLQAPEGRAAHAPARDQQARHRVERLAPT